MVGRRTQANDELRQMLNQCAMYHEKEHKSMRSARFTVKRCLYGLFGIMVLAGVCSSSTLPRLPRLVEQEDGTVRSLAAEPVSRNSVATAHVPRTKAARLQTAGALKPKTSDPKATKTMDRKAAQTTSALTGCKEFTPANGAPAVVGKKNSAGKIYSNSQEKNLCNSENPRSR